MKVSSTVLKTNGIGDCLVEFNPSVKLDDKVLVLGERATKQKNSQTAAERVKTYQSSLNHLLWLDYGRILMVLSGS